jgi:hypothetical protein
MGDFVMSNCRSDDAPWLDPNFAVGDFLRQLLAFWRVTFRENLEPALGLAARQLELSRMPGRRGLPAGPVANVLSGTLPIALATPSKVLSIARPSSDVGHWRTWIDDNAELVCRYCEEFAGSGERLHPATALSRTVDQIGGEPGSGLAMASGEWVPIVVGLAFGMLSHADRWNVIDQVTDVAAGGRCVVMVGLFGSGSDHGMRVVWPLLVPLGRYAESTALAHEADVLFLH